MSLPEVNIPTRNMIWFHSFKLVILISVTLVIEAGLVALYCALQNYAFDEIIKLASVVVLANLITGFIGWIAAIWKGGIYEFT